MIATRNPLIASPALLGALGPTPLLVAMVAEWEAVGRRMNDPALEEGPEFEALGDWHTDLQRAIYRFPSASVHDLVAKAAAFQDMVSDAGAGLTDGVDPKDTLPGAAWFGLLRDFERLARGVSEPVAGGTVDAAAPGPSLVDQILACWREWSLITDPRKEDDDPVALKGINGRRRALLDAADQLPAVPENVPVKALALAWLEYVALWENGRTRDGYDLDGRLALDVDTAICGRLATGG